MEWRAIRGTSYIYSNTDNTNIITDLQAAEWQSKGFEIALHVTTNCENWTSQTELDNLYYTPQLQEFAGKWPSLLNPVSNRTHCIAWSDWASQAKVEASKGIRLDLNYYYFPGPWVQDRPGMFTGSGMPMRFADQDGSLIDVYQVTTQMPDEADLTFPGFINTLLDNATGPLGYYGVFAANMHTDLFTPDNRGELGSTAIINSAIARGIPVISAKQLLTWLDGRNASNFANMVWNNNELSFDVVVGTGANLLNGMVPVNSANGILQGITRNGSTITYTTEVIKGINYALFDATAGSYVASYALDVTPPVITNIVATPNPNGTVTITWTTDEVATTVVDYGVAAATLNLNATNGSLVTSHSITLTGLNPGTVYYFRVTSVDGAGNSSTLPVPPATLNFVTPAAICAQDNTDIDFGQGIGDASSTVVIDGNGALILKPFLKEEFSNSGLPAGFGSASWTFGTPVTYNGGIASVENGRLYTTTSFNAGTSIEFSANFTNGTFQNIGFAQANDFGANWFVIGRAGVAGSDNNVYFRTPGSDIPLGLHAGAYHRYKISWNTNNFEFYVDGALVYTHNLGSPLSTPLLMIMSDFTTDGATLNVDWLRVSPYDPITTFVSRIMDAGSVRNWDVISWSSITPDNTSITMRVRTGASNVIDGTWTPFAERTNGQQVGVASRYIQYEATLETGNSLNTPLLQDVTFTCLAAFPVKLVDFRANAIGKDVRLEWTTATESNNKGFEIQRSLDGRTWVTVGFVPGAGNSSTTKNYNYTDRNLNSGKYLYRLKQVDYDNQYNYSGVVNISITDKQDNSLGQNHPNPFNGTTIIPYTISSTSSVRITIIDMHGRTVKVLNEGQRRAGQYNVQLNLGDLKKGVYFYRMDADNFSSTKKMIIQ